MPKSEADIRASLDAVIEDVEREQRIFGRFSDGVGNLARETKNLVLTFEHRFEQVDKRFEQVDKRFEQVDKRFEQVDKRFDRVDKEIGLLHDSVRKIDARMERLVAYIIRDETQETVGRG